MKLEQIKKVVAGYKITITKKGYWNAARHSETEVAGHDSRYTHLLWMCEEILADRVTGEKAHRWLGFIQGVLWDDCQKTIGQMKEQNRCLDEVDETEKKV